MPDQTRWTLRVSPETDNALRRLLVARGRRRGDLSRFVERAVARELLREAVNLRRPHEVDADLDLLLWATDEMILEHRLAGRTGI